MYGRVGNSFVFPRVQMYPETNCIKSLMFPVGESSRGVLRPNNGCERDYAYSCSSNREHIKIICQQ